MPALAAGVSRTRREPRARARGAARSRLWQARKRQYLYFCTTKASGTFVLVMQVSICTFVLAKEVSALSSLQQPNASFGVGQAPPN